VKLKILIVDDHIEILNVLSLALEREGYKVSICSNVQLAILLMDRPGDYNVVITDLKFDKETYSGKELIRSLIKNNYQGKIVLMTGYPDIKIPQNIASRIDFTILKPFAIEALLVWIKEHLPLQEKE